MSLEALSPHLGYNFDPDDDMMKLRFYNGMVVLCHHRRNNPLSLASPAAGVVRPPCTSRWLVQEVVWGGECGEAATSLSCLIDLRSAAELCLFGVHDVAAVLRRGHDMAVDLLVWCSGLLFRFLLGFERSMIVGVLPDKTVMVTY